MGRASIFSRSSTTTTPSDFSFVIVAAWMSCAGSHAATSFTSGDGLACNCCNAPRTEAPNPPRPATPNATGVLILIFKTVLSKGMHLMKTLRLLAGRRFDHVRTDHFVYRKLH